MRCGALERYQPGARAPAPACSPRSRTEDGARPAASSTTTTLEEAKDVAIRGWARPLRRGRRARRCAPPRALTEADATAVTADVVEGSGRARRGAAGGVG